MNDSLLKGVRVIEATQVWAGPWAGSVLADLGAEVIKVESEQKHDSARFIPPYADNKPGLNRGGFNVINRGVKSCSINLAQPRGAQLFKELVKVSDIVLENYSPKVMTAFGLDYAALCKVRPDIIMASLSGFGGTGPDRNYMAYASTVEAVAGLNSSFGQFGGEPVYGAVYEADPIGGLYGALAVLSALCLRQKTGSGQHIDISEVEGLISTLPEVVMDYTMNGRIRPRMGNRDEWMAPHGCYPCKGEDKWVAIAVGTDQEWSRFCEVMGNPDWSRNESFSDQHKRWRHQELLNQHLADWTRNFSPYEIMHKLQSVGIAAGPSFNIEELINDPHIRERGVVVEQCHPDAGRTIVYRSPWASALTKDNPPAPCFAEHNKYVFSELLGMSDQDVARLAAEKVIY